MFNKRDIVSVLTLWGVLTLLGISVAYYVDFYPLRGNHFAAQVDDAFRLLLMLSVPVFAFVTSMLLYSMLRFRWRGGPDDAAPIHTHRGITWGWFAVTSGLTIAVLIHPGFTGISELNANRHQDMVVEVLAAQWSWNLTFPNGEHLSKVDDLRLPANTRIRFDVTSRDVVHSFWLPVYRMKIDAVPGRTNSVYITTGSPVSYDEDPNVRIQCAELCGTGHPRMQVSVSVVERAEFDAWLAEQATAQQQS